MNTNTLQDIIDNVNSISECFKSYGYPNLEDKRGIYIREVYMFTQTWSTTALGFDVMIAGQAFTDALTTVLHTFDDRYFVFFDGRIAYVVENPTEKFFEDLKNHNMSNCENAEKLY